MARILSPFVRTRTRLACTVGLLAVALIAGLLPLWLARDTAAAPPAATAPGPRTEAAARAEAIATGTDVLVETATNAHEQTWALPDGQLRTETHPVVQRAKNAAGEWAPIDTTLTLDQSAGTLQPVNAVTPVRFHAGDTSKPESGGTGGGTGVTSTLAEVDVEGHTISYTWPGPLPTPVVDGARALYPEVLPGVDLLLVVRPEGGFGQMLIIKTREAAAQDRVRHPDFGLFSETATFHHQAETGGVTVRDQTGKEISTVPTPYAWDSSGGGSTSTATAADVLNLAGLGYIETHARQAAMPLRVDGDTTGTARIHLDADATGLLSDDAAVYPLFLDPTFITAQVGWTFAYKKNPAQNFMNGTNFAGSTTSLTRVGYESQQGNTGRAFWKMGFTGQMRGAAIASATFKVLNTHSWSCSPREMQLWWTGAIGTATTWNNQPIWNSQQERKSFARGYGTACNDDYVSFNLQALTQSAANGGWSDITVGMRATNESDTETWRLFQANTAVLTTVYNRAPQEPTDGISTPGGPCVPGPDRTVTVAKTNIVLSAVGYDPDENLRGLRFRFWKVGEGWPNGTEIPASNGQRVSVTIPSTMLEDKATYNWEVTSEDQMGAYSTNYPPSTDWACRITIDATAPPAPVVTSEDFPEATIDGRVWSKVPFGTGGRFTFTAAGAASFTYALDSINPVTVAASNGTVTIPDLKPRHSGPTTIVVRSYDAAGNRSEATTYTFWVAPRSSADGPGDVTGDGLPDLIAINHNAQLRTYPGDVGGELDQSLAASYTADGTPNPEGHWYDWGSSTPALITKHSDVYPGDGVTDLFARTPDGGFWVYPGDGYGSFDVGKRLRILLPANAPAPSSWTQIKAVGDVTGDKHPDLFLRTGTSLWALTGYTGASFTQAVELDKNAWDRREILNIADINLDGTPDLLWRDPSSGVVSLRPGRPGPATGSVTLESLVPASSDVTVGTGFTTAAASAIIGIPDTNGDKIPDLWVRNGSTGYLQLYHPSSTAIGIPIGNIIEADWRQFKSFA
ncbi:DNRLRE domain-containing protein [Catenuloplanes sp. NPDC051500]|uniref:DNRLRE domain-containing protein n=1 Tax=Catenuloplanes sp. NPDC051500 TaxID=3363959 RepID=UPI0037946A66